MSLGSFLPAIRKTIAFAPWETRGHWQIHSLTNLLGVGLSSPHRERSGGRSKRRTFIPHSERDNYDLQLVRYRAFQELRKTAEARCALERVKICDAKVMLVRGEEGFEPSYLLMEWLWNRHSELLKKARLLPGDALFIPRDNRTLMIVSSADPQLPDMLDQLLHQKPSEWHLSLLPLVLAGGHFSEWRPNPLHPATDLVRHIRRMEYMELFNKQRQFSAAQEGANWVCDAKLVDWTDGKQRTVTRYFPEHGINSVPLTDFILLPTGKGLLATSFGLLRHYWPEGFKPFAYGNSRVLLEGMPSPEAIKAIRQYRPEQHIGEIPHV